MEKLKILVIEDGPKVAAFLKKGQGLGKFL